MRRDFTKNDYFGPHVAFGWSDKRDGPMNQMGFEEYDEERKANRSAFLSNNFQARAFVAPKLTHSTTVEVVDVPATTEGIVIADGLVTSQKGLALTVGMGDCPPLFLYDVRKEVIGIAHCGWRGLSSGIVPALLEKMKAQFNCYPDDIKALIGTGICMSCYEIGPDVALKFGYSVLSNVQLSLSGEIENSLIRAGVHNNKISASIDCTFHTNTHAGEPKYFSHRREKSNPLNTQMAVIIMR